MDARNRIARQLRHARKLRNLTLADVASELGITYQQLQKYEHGINRISSDRLLDIATILNLPMSFFYDTQTQSERSAHRYCSSSWTDSFHLIQDPETIAALNHLVQKLALQN